MKKLIVYYQKIFKNTEHFKRWVPYDIISIMITKVLFSLNSPNSHINTPLVHAQH